MATNFQILKDRASETLLELVKRNVGVLHNRAPGSSNGPYDKHTGREIGDEEANAMALSAFNEAVEAGGTDAGFFAFLNFAQDYQLINANLLINRFKNSDFSKPSAAAASKQSVKGSPSAPNSQPISNRYSDIAGNSYDDIFDTVYGSGSDRLSDQQLAIAARGRFIVGQILGTEFGDPFANSGSILENLNILIRDITAGISDFNDFLSYIEEPQNQIYFQGLFSPNFSRVPMPKPLRIPLESLLNQNLLRPGGSGKSFSNISPGVDIFRDSYITNRGKQKADGTGALEGFPEGIIGGVPVHDLQEPQNPRGYDQIKNGLEKGNSKNPTANKLFDFKDDAKYLTPDRQERGFDSNIKADFPTLEPAVINVKPKSGMTEVEGVEVSSDALESVRLSDKQFFPFMFETENKRKVKQYAFFQAALTQLQESYSPSWQSKTFVGRTDKVHTYVDTERVLDLSFAIFASTGRALQNVRERVTWLAQQTYGENEIVGNTVTRIKAGPLLRLTIGDMFHRIPGYLRNLSFNWDFMGPGGKWELTRGLKMPQGVSVQCSFQVIHEDLPDRDLDFYKGMQPGMQPSGDKALIPLIGGLAVEGDTGSDLQESFLQRLHLIG